MPFVVPIGRYLGIRRGTDVVNPLTPVRDPDANYAVVQLATGQTAAPEQCGVLLEAATAAPELDTLLQMLPDLASKHPSGDPAVLKDELDQLVASGLIIVLDPSSSGLPEAHQQHFRLVPVQAMHLVDPQRPKYEAPESELKEYQTATAVFGLHRAVAQAVLDLPPDGTLLADIIGQIAVADGVEGRGQATALMVLALQPLLVSQATALVAQPN